MTMSTTKRSINKSVVYECMKKKMYAKIMLRICLRPISKNYHFKKPRVYIFFCITDTCMFFNIKNQICRVMTGHNMETMF